MKTYLSRMIAGLGLLGVTALVPHVAQAVPVTSLAVASSITMPVLNVFGGGPQTLAPGMTWTSTNSDAVFGYTDGYDFNGNGAWDYTKTMVGTNDASSSMSITFDKAVTAFGGFFNWAPGEGLASIAAYDVNNVLIESLDLTFLTDGSLNSGAFFGFQESGTSIKSFVMTGAYIGAADFQVQTVPEPGTVALLLGGLGLLGLVSRRKSRGD